MSAVLLRVVLVLALLALVSGCVDDAPVVTTMESTATTSDPMAGTPPTDAAIAANATFNEVPAGTADCGATVLTSGWPTTSLYIADPTSMCIANAADAGDPAQQGFWGRDNRGGIEGTILRVNGPGDITQIDYRIDADGDLIGSVEITCGTLDVPDFEPPECAVE